MYIFGGARIGMGRAAVGDRSGFVSGRVLCAAVVAIAIAVCAPLAPGAQQARPAFDAATVKLDTSNGQRSNRSTADQITFTNQTLKQLVVLAYGVLPFQVEAPEWMASTHFDITAKYPVGTKYDDRMLMLRTLLEERFHLAVHHESKEVQGYALVIAKGGFKLQPSEPGEGSVSENSQRSVAFLRATKIGMPTLAYYLGDYMGEAVVDQTGLKGVYDFELRCANDDAGASNEADAAPSVFTALQETLGVNLERKKVMIDVVVVDKADRVPAEN
jgi:uncharacterized protein (TIGR03435 family)